jgi:hypothetical protein
MRVEILVGCSVNEAGETVSQAVLLVSVEKLHGSYSAQLMREETKETGSQFVQLIRVKRLVLRLFSL